MANGKWHYFGTKANRGEGWTWVNGFWFYDGYAYTFHHGAWYRYYEENWHYFGENLPAKPHDPHGKYKTETPTNPNWKAIKTNHMKIEQHEKKKVHRNFAEAAKQMAKNKPAKNKPAKKTVLKNLRKEAKKNTKKD